MTSGLVQNTPEWLEWRRKGIGASDMAAILGVCKYSTPYKVWSEKTGRSLGFAGNFATQRGQNSEGKARARYELLNLEDMPPAIAVHPKYEILRASLDGLSLDRRRILEIKCPGRESHEQAVAGKIPDHYIPQVQFQLLVTGADECDYFSFANESHALVRATPDLEYQAMLVIKAYEFWDLVLNDTPPPLTDSDDLLVESGEVAEICAVLARDKDKLKKAELDSLKARVIEAGGHTRIRSGRVLVTRSVLKTGKTSYRLTVTANEESESA